MISQKFLLFNAEQEAYVKYVTENAPALDVGEASLKRLKRLQGPWTAKWPAYFNIDTRTHGAIEAINRSYKEYSKEINSNKQSIKNNGNLDLSEEVKNILGIHTDKTPRGHIPSPTFAPKLVLLDTDHAMVHFEATKTTDSEQNHKGLPEDIGGVSVNYTIVDADAPEPEVSDFQMYAQFGTADFRLLFTPKDTGKVGYIVAWYTNPSGEPGTISTPYKFFII